MRVRSLAVSNLVREINTGTISIAALSKRIGDLDLTELRELGRELLKRVDEKDASDTNECIAVVHAAVRRVK